MVNRFWLFFCFRESLLQQRKSCSISHAITNGENGVMYKIFFWMCGSDHKLSIVTLISEYLKYVPNLKFIRVYGGVIEERDFPIPLKPQLADREKIWRVPESLKNHALHHVIRQTGRTYAGRIQHHDNL